LLEVFAKNEQQQQQQGQQWRSQAVLLQPASGDAAAAAAAALAARDIRLEAELGELFKAEVSRAVWGRSSIGGDAAAAAAASLANGRRSSSSSSTRSNTGKERLQPLLRSARAAAAAAAAAAGDVSSPLSPFAAAAAGASYESLFSDVAAAAAASQDEGSNGVAAFAAAAAVGGDAADANAAAAAAAAAVAAASDLEPWEEVLNAAESALAAAAAAADADGGVTCADGTTRPIQRGTGNTSAAQLQLPTLQLLLEIVDGSSSVLLAARAMSSATANGITSTHGTAWMVGDMPPGPSFVASWSAVAAADVESRQARLAASLEAQRIVRDMLGAKEGWWLTEFMGSWSPPNSAAAGSAVTPSQQQQDAGDLSDIDWQLLPPQLLQQQQEWQERQQQLTPEQLRQQQLGDMTLLEETVDEDDDSWPVLGDAASRDGFYAGFYQDYGPGVQGPAGLVQPSASTAYSGFEQQAAAAAAGLGLPADLAPSELDEALETLAELKVGFNVWLLVSW
jgi:hypothetical protein